MRRCRTQEGSCGTPVVGMTRRVADGGVVIAAGVTTRGPRIPRRRAAGARCCATICGPASAQRSAQLRAGPKGPVLITGGKPASADGTDQRAAAHAHRRRVTRGQHRPLLPATRRAGQRRRIGRATGVDQGGALPRPQARQCLLHRRFDRAAGRAWRCRPPYRPCRVSVGGARRPGGILRRFTDRLPPAHRCLPVETRTLPAAAYL